MILLCVVYRCHFPEARNALRQRGCVLVSGTSPCHDFVCLWLKTIVVIDYTAGLSCSTLTGFTTLISISPNNICSITSAFE